MLEEHEKNSLLNLRILLCCSAKATVVPDETVVFCCLSYAIVFEARGWNNTLSSYIRSAHVRGHCKRVYNSPLSVGQLMS